MDAGAAGRGDDGRRRSGGLRAAAAGIRSGLDPAEADRALADFDAALKLNPRCASSLYGRGVAKRAKGDRRGADADIAEAMRLQPDVAQTMPLIAETGHRDAETQR